MLAKGTILLFIMWMAFSINFIHAAELKPLVTDKKYQFSICAIFKNEATNLKKWIEYHRAIGVDHFYLYNIGSTDSFRVVLRPYIQESLVTLINWPEAVKSQAGSEDIKWALSTQIPAYENAVNFIAKQETKWLMLASVDEYLECSSDNIKNILKKYDDYSGISFAPENVNVIIPDSQSVKQRVVQLEKAESVNKSVAKMIFKPEQCKGFIWPPYRCRFQSNQKSAEASPQELRISRDIHKNIRFLLPQKMVKYRD